MSRYIPLVLNTVEMSHFAARVALKKKCHLNTCTAGPVIDLMWTWRRCLLDGNYTHTPGEKQTTKNKQTNNENNRTTQLLSCGTGTAQLKSSMKNSTNDLKAELGRILKQLMNSFNEGSNDAMQK